MEDIRNVQLETQDLAILLRGITNSNAREFWLFLYVPPYKQDVIDSIRSTFYEDCELAEWIGIEIPCYQNFETVRGTRREIPFIHGIMAARRRMPAERVIDWLIPKNEGGKARQISEKHEIEIGTVTTQQLNEHPMLWVMDSLAWGPRGMLEIRNYVRDWMVRESGMPFPIPAAMIPTYGRKFAEASQAMQRAVKRALREPTE